MKQVAGRRIVFSAGIKRGAIHYKNVLPSVIVVVENCYPAARGFYNVLLGIDSAIDVFHAQPGWFGHFYKPRRGPSAGYRRDRAIVLRQCPFPGRR